MLKTRKEAYLEELDYMSAISCIFVVFVHVLATGVSLVDRDSWQALMIYFPWRLCSFNVSAFLFCGAVKLSAGMESGRQSPYLRYILRRILKVYLPYVIWTVVYYIIFWKVYIVKFDWRDLLDYILIGNITSPFYYIIITMQFYLLRPLWGFIVKRVPWFIGIACGIVIALFMHNIDSVLSVFGLEFEYKDRIFTTYLPFWLCGLYVGQNYEKLAFAVRGKWKPAVILAGATVFLCTVVTFLQYREENYIYDMDSFKILTDLLSIFVLLSFVTWLKNSRKGPIRPLRWLHEASLTIFFSHCLTMTVVTFLMQINGVTSIKLLLGARFLTGFTIPFILAFIWLKLKGRFARRLKRAPY